MSTIPEEVRGVAVRAADVRSVDVRTVDVRAVDVTAPVTAPGPAAPLIRFVPQPEARLRLVCFPHAGGGPVVFHRWARSLAPDLEVWSAVLAGRSHRLREPFARHWAPLVAELADAVVAAVPRPYALFGQSLGATVAFEVARELQRRGRPPVHLVTAASAAPADRQVLAVPADDDALVRAVDRHYAGIPAAVQATPELMAHVLPVLRADLELAAGYRYRVGPPLRCPVTAFAGDADASVPVAGLAAWRFYTAAGCEIHRLRGGHFCLADHEDRALGVIRRRLAG